MSCEGPARRSGTPWAWPLLICLAGLPACTVPAGAGSEELSQRLVSAGFETVRVDTLGPGCRVRLENRRFRNPNLAFGLIAALAAQECPGSCEILLERQGCAVERLRFSTADFLAMARGEAPPDSFFEHLEIEVLPDAPAGPSAARSASLRRVDVTARLSVDSQLGHVEEPFAYHVEIAPEISTQPWRGALLRLGWAFPVQHANDIAADYTRPDSHESRPEEAVLFQFLRLGGRGLASLGGGYFSGNRYGLTTGLGLARGSSLYLEGSADVSGSVAFRPELTYSGLTRITFAGSVVYHLSRPDLALVLRGGRYLYGQIDRGAGEAAVRAEVDRRFHQVEVGFFAVKSQTNHFGGVRLSLPLPPPIRLHPNQIRFDVLPEFPVEYRSDEGLYQVQPVDPRLRLALLNDLWPGSVRAQLDQWVAGYAYAAGLGPAGQP